MITLIFAIIFFIIASEIVYLIKINSISKKEYNNYWVYYKLLSAVYGFFISLFLTAVIFFIDWHTFPSDVLLDVIKEVGKATSMATLLVGIIYIFFHANFKLGKWFTRNNKAK